MKPFLLTVCENNYYRDYADSFAASAKEHGMRFEIVHEDFNAYSDEDKYRAVKIRHDVLPKFLKREPAVLVLDIDSVIRKPVVINDWYDAGFFVRIDQFDKHKHINGGCFYFTDRAIDWAWKLRDMVAPTTEWFDDQIILRDVRIEMKKQDRKVKDFDHDFFSWQFDPRASIWTGKGAIKHGEQWAQALSFTSDTRSTQRTENQSGQSAKSLEKSTTPPTSVATTSP